MQRKLGVFILSHGRALTITTHHTLRECGWTGPVTVLCDDEDPDLLAYHQLLPGQVETFSKAEASGYTDIGDNFPKRNVVTYARNAVQRLAKRQGYTHFVMLDDDYTSFSFRLDHDLQFRARKVRDLDAVLDAFVTYLDATEAAALAFGVQANYIGGGEVQAGPATLRRAMNVYVLSTDRSVDFPGRHNEDASASLQAALRGRLMLTVLQVDVGHGMGAMQAGGLRDAYAEAGDYQRAFYPVMYSPAQARVFVSEEKIRSEVRWSEATPKILRAPDAN